MNTITPQEYDALDQRITRSTETEWTITETEALLLGRITGNGATLFFSLSPRDTEQLLSDLEAHFHERTQETDR